MGKRLNQKQLLNLQGKRCPQSRRLWDGDGEGFGVKVSAAGRLSFFQCYYAPAGTVDKDGNDISGKRRFMTLGTFSKDGYTLAQARADASDARALLDKGIDPQEFQREQRDRRTKQKQQEAKRGTLASVLALYIWNLRKKGRARRYIYDSWRAWYRDVFPVVGKITKAADVSAQDVRKILHRPLSRGAEHSARTLRASLHLAFKLALQADNDPRSLSSGVEFRVTYNPVEAVPLDVKVTPGDRELSFDEIGRVWRDIEKAAAYPMDALLIRLLLAFGGQHITELREATWDEFDLTGGRWLIRAQRHKNRARDHLVPINATAAELLEQLRAQATGIYLFPQHRNPQKPMRLERPGDIIRRFHKWQVDNGEAMEKFTAADFRRTCKTRMHEIGISKETTNHLHNHDFAGVSAKHYDRWDYFDEKQRAMTAWNIALQAAIKKNPVPIAKCRGALRWRSAHADLEVVA